MEGEVLGLIERKRGIEITSNEHGRETQTDRADPCLYVSNRAIERKKRWKGEKDTDRQREREERAGEDACSYVCNRGGSRAREKERLRKRGRAWQKEVYEKFIGLQIPKALLCLPGVLGCKLLAGGSGTQALRL